jgi:hypothetical protein
LAVGLAVPVLPLLLWSCNSHPLQKPTPQTTGEIAQFREVNPIRNVDVVFVIDNSGSMSQEQDNLARNFPTFMDELANVQGADIRIGVVSSDMGSGPTGTNGCGVTPGDNGVMCSLKGVDRCAACGVQAGGRYLRTVMPNYAGNVRDVFSCIARLGTSGCGFEHSIGALQRALESTENGDFLRPDAYLAFVLITDEEDCTAPPDTQLFAAAVPGNDWSLRCSLEAHTCNGVHNPGTADVDLGIDQCEAASDGALRPVKEMVDAILAKKNNDPSLIIAAGIFGWPLPGQEGAARYRQTAAGVGGGGQRGMRAICNSANGDATPAYRVKSFVESFANNSTYSICQNDFREAMRRIGAKIRATVGPACIEARLVDIGPTTIGTQADCTVTERTPLGMNKYEEKVLTQCTGNDTNPCWQLVPDMGCTTSQHRVDIVRPGGVMPVEGTQQSIRCLSCLSGDCGMP